MGIFVTYSKCSLPQIVCACMICVSLPLKPCIFHAGPKAFITRSLLKHIVCMVAKQTPPIYVIQHKQGHHCPHHMELMDLQSGALIAGAATAAGGTAGSAGAGAHQQHQDIPADHTLGLPLTDWLTGK